MDSNSRKRKIEAEGLNDDDNMSDKTVVLQRLCSQEEDIKLTFGLKYDFLKSLGIRPPIEKWVYVCNFRCDKSELKEILELAGHVIICAVFAKISKSAKVMYSHPLEAVQAVSMLNGQTFYGQKLHVSMISCPSDTFILPKGLSNVGPGLGMNGKPLRDIAKHYTKFLKNQASSIDETLFLTPDEMIEDNLKMKEECESEIRDDVNKDEKDKVSAEKHLSPYQRTFNVANVDDLPDVEDDASNSSESKMKKAKKDSSDASDQESEEGMEKRSNTSREDRNSVNVVVSRRNSNTDRPKPAQNCNNQDNPRSSYPPLNVGAPNFTPSVTFSSGPQMVASNPVMMNSCPPGPMIGPHPQAGPAGPFGPPRPAGPSVSGPAMRPVGIQVGLTVPPLGPLCSSLRPGPIGPSVAPIGLGPPRPMGPTGPNPGPFPPQIPSAPFQPMGNPKLGPRPMMDGSVPGPAITIQFRNLPPTTTFPLLCEKVAQCGQVLSLQLTTPGCAVARFAHRAHADRCFQFFNGKFIDGHVIEVRYA